ncbi:MAG: XdhC family protein [Asticcacaulis sp.]|uniref:XdhC family protein n=1 Tax=Asticcacaulis sp. TaxID=1872648 RepID=UPI003F7B907B
MADGQGIDEAKLIAPPVYQDYVLEALADWRAQGLRTALLTLIGLEGGAPRPLGSQMAVAEDGRAVGAISGGCAEQALILDALAAMRRGQNHVELYGEGSRFKDIILPCGAAIHVGFDVTLDEASLNALIAARRARQDGLYVFEADGMRFEKRFRPQTRLLLFGASPVLPFLIQMARLSEGEVMAWSPDAMVRACTEALPLHSAQGWDGPPPDAHTAVVSLFHDHAFEPPILDAALRSEAFYIGALGSRATHARRLDALRVMGWDEASLTRIHAPVGLDIAAQTPPEIAVATLAQIIAHRPR